MVLMVMNIKKRILYISIFISAVIIAVSGQYVYANGGQDALVVIEDAEPLLPVKNAKSENATVIIEKEVVVTETVPVQAQEVLPAETVLLVDDPNGMTIRNAYRVGPGDRLEMTVYGEDGLSKQYQVDGQGNISVPLIGVVSVEGLTPIEIEALVAERLRDGYLIDPSVTIEITEYRPFYIMGEVRRPGSYNYIDGMNVLNAVAVGGGFTYRAKTKEIEVVRSAGNDSMTVTLKPEDQIMPGDIIRIKERFF
ncbi:MAG: hypothetical protein CL565_05935 [Alphaproteobacteria bacterium]|nr:hypothetical protein [Alphaproteobacteria bacterium]|tara:strand:+ start:3137 stop:3892 length:756 start_codon:yes stop_codon:yes gene_type:complete